MYVSFEYKGVGKQLTNVLLLCLFLHKVHLFLISKTTNIQCKEKQKSIKLQRKKYFLIATKQPSINISI